MSIEAYKERYKGMSAAEVRSLISSSKEFRDETERLYTSIYSQKLNKSCGDCWLDAYILIMRGDPIKQKTMQEKKYKLRAGAVLVDPYGDPKKTVTHHNITDDLALYHLRTHPDCARLFANLPAGWQKEAVKSEKVKPVKIEVPEDNSDLEGMTDEERAVFEGYNRAQRDRIREILADADSPEDALDRCSILESEGYDKAAEKLRPIVQQEIVERNQAKANREAVEAIEAAIEAIGEVTPDDDCKARIDSAKKLYEALSDEQKEMAVDACLKLDVIISAYDVAVREVEAAQEAAKKEAEAEAQAEKENAAEGKESPEDGKENPDKKKKK